jgi:hypothetical protein
MFPFFFRNAQLYDGSGRFGKMDRFTYDLPSLQVHFLVAGSGKEISLLLLLLLLLEQIRERTERQRVERIRGV